jgi:hypothetical protein
MPRPKLSATQVRRIKMLLEGGEHSHQQIADKYKVARCSITKIHLGMKNPTDKNGRWGDIDI